MSAPVVSRPARGFAASIAEGNQGYMSGFGNGFETEALPGALPIGRNSPQKCPYGLYAEQCELPIQPLRWAPPSIPNERLTFVTGVRTMTTAGDAGTMSGMGAHVYFITESMVDEYYYNADGEMMFVPQEGCLRIATEFGVIDVEPCEIAVIPRGVKIRVELIGGKAARGYLCENYGAAFTLPERGPIGANCMANQRDFLTPVAAYEDRDVPSTLYVKWGGAIWRARLEASPLDVVAWHGNYAPYKYDLRHYSPVGPILYDHADPSIFTVRKAGGLQARRHEPA